MIQAYLLWETTFHPFVNCLQSSMPRCLYTSMLLHLQRASRAPFLHASVPPRLQRAFIPIPPCRYTCSAPPELDASRARCLHSSTSLHLYRASRPPCLHCTKLA